MIENSQNSTLQALINESVRSLGFTLWGFEYIPEGKYTVLRIYIEKEGGISIEDCKAVSSQLGAVLDVEDIISGKYALEVSSPGLDRRFFTKEQLAEYCGSEVSVKTKYPVEEKRHFKGIIKNVEDDKLVLLIDGEVESLALSDIKKAKLVPKID